MKLLGGEIQTIALCEIIGIGSPADQLPELRVPDASNNGFTG